MKRKKTVIVAIIGIMTCGFSAGIYAQSAKINRDQVSAPNEADNQTVIVENVLENTGRDELYDVNDLERITIYFGNADNIAGTNEAVISANFGPKNTVVAVYAPNGEVYEYVAELGNFYNVSNIEFVPVEGLGKDIIIVEEGVNQQIGSFENVRLFRGYLYDNNGFTEVLNTPVDIDAAWNTLWSELDIEDADEWRRVTDDTESKWNFDDKASPKLDVVRYQKYFTAPPTENNQVPADSEFSKVSDRVVTESIYWSDKWQRFIIGEAIDKTTNEPVAILINRDNEPYALAGFIENSFLVQREDGTREIVIEENLDWQVKPGGGTTRR